MILELQLCNPEEVRLHNLVSLRSLLHSLDLSPNIFHLMEFPYKVIAEFGGGGAIGGT
jgi:hypothetical protein